MKGIVEVDLKVLRNLQRDAERYRFLRDVENWGEDSGDDSWDMLTDASVCDFDEIVDSRINREGYEGV